MKSQLMFWSRSGSIGLAAGCEDDSDASKTDRFDRTGIDRSTRADV